MKLTKTMREAFVRAAMLDVPSVDYNEQARVLVQAEALKLMPPSLQKLVKAGSVESEWVKQASVQMPGLLSNVSIYWKTGSGYGGPDPAIFPTPIQSQIAQLSRDAMAQDDQHRQLQQKLSAAANSATTRKALAELLPEFEKYLPADAPAACRSLPAIANVVAEFSKAGWPKSAKGGAK